ncbi:MAG: hypothetical protein A2849_01335 [Candidatus Taylorbacteria bacterium RIFCSPHIGHO2_01_FULL_51_15]|uniref:DUF2283 domain-containing protein n=1 Tax=Candidatus Taylorbacteria bacterium RIFCSPHIGHO2_01_FULL_51_15 TaxID=1802304 RepID=A0A1G2MBI1_9BACT|nr:MAG: hypothetical protein A2849_01335 [Candidatus Taylorbacteria bacterium RIFCSPHIGHO2_01_FULL_51_15]
MNITYDKTADAMYLYFQKGKKISRTVELADLLIADLDKQGKVIGVEVLCASRQLVTKRRGKKMKAHNFLKMDIPVTVSA